LLPFSLGFYSLTLPPNKMTTLKTKEDVLSYLSAETEEQAKRHLFKGTNCGAYISFDEKGITLGSIVEGSDSEVITDPLIYPFTSKAFEESISYIESEADSLWKEANE
jgi:hypothetical protein